MPVLKLRQADVRALPFVGRGAKHQCIYWDTALPCFGLRIYPKGAVAQEFRRTVLGLH